MKKTHTIYYCGISQKYHLDTVFLVETLSETGQTAKLNNKWVKKLSVGQKMILGNNVSTFKDYRLAKEFCETNNLNFLDYTPYTKTNAAKWVEV